MVRRLTKKQHRKKKLKGRDVRKQSKIPAWLPFRQVPNEEIINQQPEHMREQAAASIAGAQIYVNNHYYVTARQVPTGFGLMFCLEIRRHDQEPIHDWRELQKVKNMLVGSEAEGVELYPAESRLVDASNVTYMYCLPAKTGSDNKPLTDENGLWQFQQFPFGFGKRLVSETPTNIKQRPWRKEDRPNDLVVLTPEKIKAAFEEFVRKRAEAQRAQEEAQGLHQGVQELQDAEEPSKLLDTVLGASKALVVEKRGQAFVDNMCGRVLELVNYRKGLMAKQPQAPGDVEDANNLAGEINRIIKMFDDVQKEAESAEQQTPLGDGLPGGSGESGTSIIATETPAGEQLDHQGEPGNHP
jgi:hypothetical protein